MEWFAPKLPIDDKERLWVDRGFRRLEAILGRTRMLEARVIVPDADCFPERYDKSTAAAEKLFQRICGYMQVDWKRVELEIFPDETEELRQILPYWSGGSDGCAGLYTHDSAAGADASAEGAKHHRMLVAIRSTQLQDPFSLVATIAHELGHYADFRIMPRFPG